MLTMLKELKGQPIQLSSIPSDLVKRHTKQIPRVYQQIILQSPGLYYK